MRNLSHCGERRKIKKRYDLRAPEQTVLINRTPVKLHERYDSVIVYQGTCPNCKRMHLDDQVYAWVGIFNGDQSPVHYVKRKDNPLWQQLIRHYAIAESWHNTVDIVKGSSPVYPYLMGKRLVGV